MHVVCGEAEIQRDVPADDAVIRHAGPIGLSYDPILAFPCKEKELLSPPRASVPRKAGLVGRCRGWSRADAATEYR